MKILAIGAHPDDIEVGCAGTLMKYSKSDHEIFLLIITEGHKGGDAKRRCEEQYKAAEILKPKEVMWAGYKDTELSPNMNELIHDIEAVLNKIQPDFTFTNYGDDTHQDHRALCKATVSATRYIKNVIFYETPTTLDFSPNVFVDIKETIEDKVAMLLAHQSQVMKTNIEGLSIVDAARSTAMFRGIQGRVQYAEAFLPLRLFINI
jgi:LmbE family N-acetylglucosaminyl deacetylase